MASAFEEFASFCKSYDSDLEKMSTARSLIQDVLKKPLKPEVADALFECFSELSLHTADETTSLAEDGTESCAETPSIFSHGELEYYKKAAAENGGDGDASQTPNLEPASSSVESPAPKKPRHNEPGPNLPIDKKEQLGVALEAIGIPEEVKHIIASMRDEPQNLDWNSPRVRKIERLLIFKLGLVLKFKQRGPPGPEEGGPKRWGGQVWRKEAGRWGNRGGKNKAYYNWVYGKKKNEEE